MKTKSVEEAIALFKENAKNQANTFETGDYLCKQKI